MKTSRITSLFLLAGLALGATASQADGLRFFAGKEAGFKFEPTIALTGGVMKATAANEETTPQTAAAADVAHQIRIIDSTPGIGLISPPTMLAGLAQHAELPRLLQEIEEKMRQIVDETR